MNKQIDVWVLSIEDTGSPAESWVFGTNTEALAKLRDWHLDLAVGSHRATQDYDDLENLDVREIADYPRIVEVTANNYAAAHLTVDSIMPAPDTEVIGEALWDDRVVWLEKHTLTLAARKEYAA